MAGAGRAGQAGGSREQRRATQVKARKCAFLQSASSRVCQGTTGLPQEPNSLLQAKFQTRSQKSNIHRREFERGMAPNPHKWQRRSATSGRCSSTKIVDIEANSVGMRKRVRPRTPLGNLRSKKRARSRYRSKHQMPGCRRRLRTAPHIRCETQECGLEGRTESAKYCRWPCLSCSGAPENRTGRPAPTPANI